MKILILSLAAGLNEILSSHLRKIGFSAETVDYGRPLKRQIEDADVLINGLGKVDRSIIDACPKLKLVHQIGTGIDNVDVDYCTSRAVHVAHVPRANSAAVAEHTLFLMTHMAKNMKSAGKGLMQRRVINVLGSELQGKTVLLIGLGHVGSEVAKRAKAFEMEVIAVTRHPEKQKTTQAASGTVTELGDQSELLDFLPRADYISLHTSLNDETLGLIAEEEFGLMKKRAYVINVARAQIVDRNALFEALSNRRIAGAAFDVFWEEPANPNDRILQLDNFVLTPHVAGWTVESANAAAKVMSRNIKMVAHGKAPLTAINSL